ncbi:MAG: ankyrin repeat domain-containing protein [Acidobacteria bacterium]|nr:ankyrin repeat domain-containing protein [Acidobacteriota bacterium]
MSTLENLRKSARRWLKALRADDADAHARLERAHPNAPSPPALREVQHALAREHGHESWVDLRRALDDGRRRGAATPDADQYDAVAKDVLAVYQTGDGAAIQRLQERFRRPVTWETLRAEVDHQLEQLPDSLRPSAGLSLADIRHFMARSAGFQNWASFLDALRLDGEESEANARAAVVVPRQSDPGPSGILQPVELRITLPMELQGGKYTMTTDVWNMLAASRAGDLERVKLLVAATPGLVRCEHNYMPPLHLAVREGHKDLVGFLLERGAFDPEHVTYPYNEKLLTIAEDRDYAEIARLLCQYAGTPSTADGEAVHGVGTIQFPADDDVNRLEKLVAANALSAVEKLLERRPELVHYELACWAEGVLSTPANRAFRQMLELLLRLGARVPDVAKWGRAYYFKHYDIAAFLLERGMNPNHMNWHRTTLLHDMAWEGDVRKAVLLLDSGANIDAVDDEFRSTPLGIAARGGRLEVVRLLLDRGADPNTAGASWATPLAWAVKKKHSDIAAVLRSAGAR